MGSTTRTGLWRPEGDGWLVGIDGSRTFLRDAKGLRHIAHLLERPGAEVSALDLVGAVEGTAGAAEASAQGDAGPALDEQAKQQYRHRLETLSAELDAADRRGDAAAAERLSQEFEFLSRELRSAVGLGGRDRRTGSALERARVNVTRSIKTALQRIEAADPALGEHLRAGIRTGTYCVYQPPAGEQVAWTAELPAAPAAPPAAAPAVPPSIMFCDLEDSTALMERVGEAAWLDLLAVHNQIIRAQVAEHGGREVKATGDGFMLSFPDAREALWAAADMQRELAQHAERNPSRPLRVRIGIHTGDAHVDEDDLLGRSVITAARLSQAASGGQVLLSEAVRDAAGGELGELALGPPRSLRLRGLRGTHRAYELLWRGEADPLPAAAPSDAARAEVPEALLEREPERARLRAVLDLACGGRGSVVVLDGPAGIGKTTLARDALAAAEHRGMRVLRARASELERAIPFGIVRQLFEPALRSLVDERRIELLRGAVTPAADMLGRSPSAGETQDVVHVLNGLVWLAAGLAEDAPLAIAIDDAQWADEQTQAWLEFMAVRVAELPVVLVVVVRGGAGEELTARLATAPGVEVISPAPLSEEAVAALVRKTWPEADTGFCRACHGASAGNPFFLRELLAAARAAGVDPTEAGIARLQEITPDSVARMVLGRLRPLGAPALALARALAVLGGRADLTLVGEVAEVGEALAAADALGSAGLVVASDEVAFAHPLIAAVVERDVPPGARSRLHELAAERLLARGASAGEIAVHLLKARPSGSSQALACLRAAARQARRDGAPASAARFLERALREPPPAEALPEVLLELGWALRDAGRDDEATPHFDRAIELARDPVLRAKALLSASRSISDAPDAHVRRLDEAVAELPDSERELRYALEARALEILGDLLFVTPSPDVTRAHDERLARIVSEVGVTTGGERELLSISAVHRAIRAQTTSAEAKAVALRALDNGVLMRRLADGAWACDSAVEALVLADAFDEADRHAREAERHARARGAVISEAYACMLRALIALHRGALLDAESLLRSVFAITRGTREQPYIEYQAQQIRACVAIERGDLPAAGRACEALQHTMVSPMGAPHGLGRLFAARGEHELAVPQLQAAHGMQQAAGLWRTMVMGPARVDLALSLVAVGRRDEAAELADAEVRTARAFGAPGALGIALRTLARTQADPDAGRALLQEAADVLSGSLALLARGQVLCDLGAARRAAGDLAGARHVLRQALDLAVRCGARRLIDQVTGELALAGVRPSKPEPVGRELLSPAERRIAELAAEGASELEIAQSLFLTPRAVEDGLAIAIGKLGVSSREALRDVVRQEMVGV